MSTFEEQVNEVVAKASTDEQGNLQLPEGVEASPEVLYAAKLEKRHRDTQSSYTRSQQQNKLLQAENARLAESWEADAVESLTAAQQSKLQELKVQDTDAYIEEVAKIKDAAKSDFQARKAKLTDEVTKATELETREAQLDAYNAANPNAQITSEVIDNDVPPRVVKQLEKGEITFEEFLNKAGKYLTTPKKVKPTEKAEGEPDLSKAGGGDTPSDSALSKQSSSDYSKEIF